jgi:hypothetical protein
MTTYLLDQAAASAKALTNILMGTMTTAHNDPSAMCVLRDLCARAPITSIFIPRTVKSP